jgi:putative ABC transport system ATP-binding protein
MAACRAEALSKTYGRRDTAVHALREITLSIPSHAFTAIMGPSGSGKSTLLHCLAALDTPTSGRVFLGQTELTSLSRRQQAQVRRDRIGFVFQAFNLVPTLDAIENITLPQLLAGRRPNKEWLEYVVAQIGLRDRLHHRPSQLSGGQQQRVALARALAGRPEVIFADEPTGNLDTKASREMLSLLRSAVDDFRQTVVIVTHDPAIAGYADQVLFFMDGQVVDQVLHPEQDLVLEHLQYLDSSTPAHRSPRRQLRASMQEDGQHIMRSRRRRRGDETGPGRPMVGSDDEVEVARQERWLQRIREQFDVEHEAASAPNGYHTGAIPPDTGNGFPPAEPHTTGNGFPPAAEPHTTGNGYHPEPVYDTHSGYPSDGYAPAAHTTGNGFPPAEPHTTGNGFPPAAHTTGNGFPPAEPHTTGNGFPPAEPHTTGNGYHPEHAVTQMADTTGDDGWLPADRSWLSDTSSTTGINQNGHQPDTSPAHQQNGQWSQATPVGDEYPTQRTPDPVPADRGWHSDSWDFSEQEQTQRWLPPAGSTSAPAEQTPALPARSWREERQREAARESSNDAWSTPAVSSDGEWATIPPPTSSPDASSTGRWDAAQPPEQNGWPSQPTSRYEPADPPAGNGHSNDNGWQRWDPDPYSAGGNGAEPPPSGHGNGYHGDASNGQASAAHTDEPYAQRNGSSPDSAQVHSNGANGLSPHGAGPREQSSDGWLAPVDSRSGWSDDGDKPDRIEDPVRELLDIWSPTEAAGNGRPQQDPAAPASPVHAEPTPHTPVDDGWGPEAQNGHHTNGWGRADSNGHHTNDGWGSSGEDGRQAAGEWGSSAQWQVDYTPGVNHEPHELPPEHLAGPATSSTTDPFEALHSLQSQLNRLGGGRKAPRRYED